MNAPKITSASVKVMRSYDYCHFEIVLGMNAGDGDPMVDVDALRKEAARLADKAVEQYKIAKRNEQLRQSEAMDREQRSKLAERIRAMGEMERSPQQQAFLKAFDDEQFHARRRYDYEDEWDEPQDE